MTDQPTTPPPAIIATKPVKTTPVSPTKPGAERLTSTSKPALKPAEKTP